MKVFLAHIHATGMSLLRVPSYWVPTLLFPTMLYSFFGTGPSQSGVGAANFIMASFSAFAVIGVVFYQFGVGIAQDRINPWDSYLRALPAGPMPRIFAQLVVALGFAMVSVGLVMGLATWLTPASLNLGNWLRLIFGLVIGAAPFAMIGITIGYVAPPKAAVPIANLLHLPLTFAGGLWMPPDSLPSVVAAISPYLPTRHLGEVVWSSALDRAWPTKSLLWLGGYFVVFTVLAIWARRRDEGQRFR